MKNYNQSGFIAERLLVVAGLLAMVAGVSAFAIYNNNSQASTLVEESPAIAIADTGGQEEIILPEPTVSPDSGGMTTSETPTASSNGMVATDGSIQLATTASPEATSSLNNLNNAGQNNTSTNTTTNSTNTTNSTTSGGASTVTSITNSSSVTPSSSLNATQVKQNATVKTNLKSTSPNQSLGETSGQSKPVSSSTANTSANFVNSQLQTMMSKVAVPDRPAAKLIYEVLLGKVDDVALQRFLNAINAIPSPPGCHGGITCAMQNTLYKIQQLPYIY